MADPDKERPTSRGEGISNELERKRKFARAMARAEFGRFYWSGDPAEYSRNANRRAKPPKPTQQKVAARTKKRSE